MSDLVCFDLLGLGEGLLEGDKDLRDISSTDSKNDFLVNGEELLSSGSSDFKHAQAGLMLRFSERYLNKWVNGKIAPLSLWTRPILFRIRNPLMSDWTLIAILGSIEWSET